MSSRASLSRVNGLLRSSRFLSNRTTASRLLASRTQTARLEHSVPKLGKHDEVFTQDGIEGLFSADGFKMAWTEYQTMNVNRLNHILAGDPRENWDVKSVLVDTARNPQTANTFNYASMAHNNHFFFKCLSPEPVEIPVDLAEDLSHSFSSVENLRKVFLTTAASMFGPGFVWLVQLTGESAKKNTHYDSSGRGYRQFRIVSTYLAGSPYPGAHHRQQNRDLNTSNVQSEEELFKQTRVQNRVGAFGGSSAQAFGMGDIVGSGPEHARYGGAEIVPVLCANTWQHCYLMDWGLQGKMNYLESWWDHIDWNVVNGHTVKDSRTV